MKGIRLVKEKGKPEEVIVPLVNQIGQVAAAKQLGIAAATVNLWLKENGYVKEVRYVKKEGQAS